MAIKKANSYSPEQVSLAKLAYRRAVELNDPDPEGFVAQLIQESELNPNARGSSGEVGIAQFMPGTSARFKGDPSNPVDAIDMSLQYRKVIRSYNKRKHGVTDEQYTLWGYNAGEGNSVRASQGLTKGGDKNYVNNIAGKRGLARELVGLPDVDNSSSGTPNAASAASAMGVGGNEADAVQKAYEAAGKAHQNSAESQRNYANNIANMAGAAPDLAASVTESLASSNAALSNFSATSRATVDRTFAELEQKDIARRAILQGMMTDKNLDPTVQGSIADMSTDNMAMLNRRMNATILAEQATNEMSIADNPAGFFEKMLFGNLYSQGRQELRSQFNDLQAVTDGTINTVNAQYKQAADAKIGDPALDKMKMDATLKMAEIDKDVAIQQAQTPAKTAEAQVEAMRLQAQMMGYSVTAMGNAYQSEVQASNAAIDAAKAPLDSAVRKAQATSAQNAAASGNMELAQQKQFFQAQNDLMEIEINGKTDDAKRKAKEARAALNAATVLDASGSLDTAAFERAMADVNKAKNEYLGTTAAVGSNAAVKEVEARNAQFEQTIEAKPNPEYAALKDASDMASFKANIAQIEKDKGSEAAIQAGFVALGLPPTADVSKYPPDVQNAIKAAGQGQKGGVNPVTAAQAFVTGGVAASSPELAMTAQAVLGKGKPDAVSGAIVPFSGLKDAEKEALSATEIQAAINLFENNKTPMTPVFSNQYIYGMLPPAVLSSSPHTTAAQKKSLETFNATAAKHEAAATSIQAMITALSADGVSPDQIPKIVSGIASASLQHNNATRKYNLLGLPDQEGVSINYDPFGPNLGRRTELDMTDEADVQLLVMDMRTKALLSDPNGILMGTTTPLGKASK